MTFDAQGNPVLSPEELTAIREDLQRPGVQLARIIAETKKPNAAFAANVDLADNLLARRLAQIHGWESAISALFTAGIVAPPPAKEPLADYSAPPETDDPQA